MDSEYILYIQEQFENPEFMKSLNSHHISFQKYSSKSHHPNAMLLHRSQMTKRIVSSTFSSNQKSLIIYFPSIPLESSLNETTEYLSKYIKNNIKVIVIIQGSKEYFDTNKPILSKPDADPAHPEPSYPTRESFESLLVDWMLQGTDCIQTSSTRETTSYIEKIVEILTKNPYRSDPSKFRIQGKKLKANSEIPQSQRNWALQLINIQGISESKALKVLSKFPKLADLLEYYQDPSIAQKDKQNALTFISDRKEKRISQRVYLVYNSTDGDSAV